MTDKKIEAMLLAVIERLDYDHFKHFLPECSEDPAVAKETMQELIDIARKHCVATSKQRRTRNKC